jgi:putative ABC transport system permease protein
MASAALTKSITDLTRRKARTLFAVLTLAIAVASVGIFAAPTLMDRAMQKEVAANKLPDVTLSTKPLELTPAQLAALGRLPNVEAAQAVTYFQTRVWLGARRDRAIVVGIPDFSHQPANVVAVVDGSAPAEASVLSDTQNAKQGRYDGQAGDSLRIIAVGGRTETVRIAGTGRNLLGGQMSGDNDAVVLYATASTVARLSGQPGYSELQLQVTDHSPAAIDATIGRVQRNLRANTSFAGFSNLPSVRSEGDYPGKEFFGQLTSLMNLFTVLALLSALVLIANTMTTLIAEQRREIGTMKAIGGTRKQIARVYYRTALLLGAAGSVLGVGLGLLIANGIVRLFGTQYFAITPGFGVVGSVIVVSLVIGVLAPPLAARRAVRRGIRIPVREALQDSVSLDAGARALDNLLRRLAYLPRTAQIGIRSVTRRLRRSLATIVQVGLAVATLLAVLSLVAGVTRTTAAVWDDLHFDVMLNTAVGKQFDARAVDVVRSTPGVSQSQGVLINDVTFAGNDATAWGLPPQPLFQPKVSEGRWYTPAEEDAGARVTVLTKDLVKAAGTRVGDDVRLETAAGPASFRVIGITSSQWDTAFYTPLATLKRTLRTTTTNQFFVRVAGGSHDAIDATTTRLEDRLTNAGYAVGTLVKYSARDRQVSANRQLSLTIGVLGLLVVAISMVGLINAITMSVLERTREIGVLRCIGARGRDIRRIFAAEGLTVAFSGWLLGLPLGYGLARLFNWLVLQVTGIEFAFVFPPQNVLFALVGTVVLGLLVIRIPLRRAVRFRPGDAIRYA